MLDVYHLLSQIKTKDVTTILYGESGTGKNLVANTLHKISLRRDRPNIAVNCPAIPSELLESELFGHEKGAFTGAVERKDGKFLAANSGTNQSLDFTEPTKNFYVSGIENVMIDGERESLVLNLVSREAITNETVRVGKKFSTDSNISNTVRDILKNYIKTDKINQIETTMNNYGFIGNMKKPFQILTWLASKSISGESEESSGGNSAGIFFYQTKNYY